ncbi:integral membrane sensor signal transduction histidine kinase [Anaeromyxobacter sp. K]|uniref:sensor histidine kinase n=1 Tax=Anaeromyxobacter sp. (strain K) TaxID=447217 RepID=UPI00017BE3F5|nr:HAMP domain-containing sensor histidine kinase [Anaeromyxobacter sp. K]ACG74439.1 integral membrane sensor signal transduction histidine kinase [Anaeromyxobacter sp. K]
MRAAATLARRRVGSGPPLPERIQREEFSRLFGRLLTFRLWVLLPALLLVGWVVWIDPSPWRRAVLLVAFVAVSTFFVRELFAFRAGGAGQRSVNRNVLLATFGQLVISFATGGIDSPFLPAALVLAVIPAMLVEGPVRWLIPAMQISGVLTLAALGASGAIPDLNLAAFGGGTRVGTGTAYLWADAALLCLMLAGVHALGNGLRHAYQAVLRRQLAAQEDALRAHQERAAELVELSGEIAHELKNPLASVKALAGLLRQQLPDGKGAERLEVLRHEVDRMQSVLEDFLNFSRPLVPLSVDACDLAALCQEVAALHEGVASERGLELSVEGDGVSVRGDRRKLKQVLINLVQNAVEASAPGGEVVLEVAPAADGGARVRVLDRGAGVDPALGDAVFHPGVTSKAKGSGLGLTVARAIARQHGGDLALAPRPDGGTAAELVLPARPAAPGP